MAERHKIDLPVYLRTRAARAHDEYLGLDERVYNESAELIEDLRKQLKTARGDALLEAAKEAEDPRYWLWEPLARYPVKESQLTAEALAQVFRRMAKE